MNEKKEVEIPNWSRTLVLLIVSVLCISPLSAQGQSGSAPGQQNNPGGSASGNGQQGGDIRLVSLNAQPDPVSVVAVGPVQITANFEVDLSIPGMIQGKSGEVRQDGKRMILQLNLKIKDSEDRVVRELQLEKEIKAEETPDGRTSVERTISDKWDGTNDNGELQPDGTYTAVASGKLFVERTPPNAANQKTTRNQLASSAGDSVSFVMDNTKPEISFDSPGQGAFVATPRPTIRGTLTDNLSGVDLNTLVVTINGMDFTDATNVENGTFTVTVPSGMELPDGNTTVEVTVSDRAQNEKSKDRTFTIDTTPPGITLKVKRADDETVVNPFGETVQLESDDFQLTVTFDDTASGADRVAGLDQDRIEAVHNEQTVTDAYDVASSSSDSQPDRTISKTLTFQPEEGKLASLRAGINDLLYRASDRLDNQEEKKSKLDVPATGLFSEGEPFRVRLEKVAGQDQTCCAGAPLDPTPAESVTANDETKLLRVKVTNPEGTPLPGVPVRWKFSEPGTRIIPPYSDDGLTNDRGKAFTNIMVPEIDWKKDEKERTLKVTATVDFAEVQKKAVFDLTIKNRIYQKTNDFPTQNQDKSNFNVFLPDIPIAPGEGFDRPLSGLFLTGAFKPPTACRNRGTRVMAPDWEAANQTAKESGMIVYPMQSNIPSDSVMYLPLGEGKFKTKASISNEPGTVEQTFNIQKGKYKYGGPFNSVPHKPIIDRKAKANGQAVFPNMPLSKKMSFDIGSFVDENRDDIKSTVNGEIVDIDVRLGMSGAGYFQFDSGSSGPFKVINSQGDSSARSLDLVISGFSPENDSSKAKVQFTPMKNVDRFDFRSLPLILVTAFAEANFTVEDSRGQHIINRKTFGPNYTFELSKPVFARDPKATDQINGGGINISNNNETEERDFDILGNFANSLEKPENQIIEPKFPVTVNKKGQTVPRKVSEKNEFVVKMRGPAGALNEQVDKDTTLTAAVFVKNREGFLKKPSNCPCPEDQADGDKKAHIVNLDRDRNPVHVAKNAGDGPFARTCIKVELSPLKKKNQPHPDRYWVYRSDPIVVTGQGTMISDEAAKSALQENNDGDDILGPEFDTEEVQKNGKRITKRYITKLPGKEGERQRVLQYRGDGRVQVEIIAVDDTPVADLVSFDNDKDRKTFRARRLRSASIPILQKRVILLGIDSLGSKQFLQIEDKFPWNNLFGKFEKIVNKGIKNTQGTSVKRYSKSVKINAIADWPPITFANWASIYTGEPPGETLIPGNNFWARLVTKEFAVGRSQYVNVAFGIFTFSLSTNFEIPFRAFSFGSSLFDRYMTDAAAGSTPIPEDQFTAYALSPRLVKGLLNMALNGSRFLNKAGNFDQSVDTIYEEISMNKAISQDQMWDVMQRNVRGVDLGNRWITLLDVLREAQDLGGALEGATATNEIESAFLKDNSIIETFQNQSFKSFEDSRLISFYLPGNDFVYHGQGFERAKDYMKKLASGNDLPNDGLNGMISELKERRLFNNTIFVLLSDHGQHDFGTEVHLRNIDELDKTKSLTKANEEKFQITLKELYTVAGLPFSPSSSSGSISDPVDSRFAFISSSDASEANDDDEKGPSGDVVCIPDDSIAHIYFTEDTDDNVKKPPSKANIMVTAEKFLQVSKLPGNRPKKFNQLILDEHQEDMNIGKIWQGDVDTKKFPIDNTKRAFGKGSGGIILVKYPQANGDSVNWKTPYHVFRGLDNDKQTIPISEFSDWPSGTIRDKVKQIQEANSVRMGEIILIPNKHFYFSNNGKESQLDSGHGSLLHEDASVPFQVGGPKITSTQVDVLQKLMNKFRNRMTGSEDHFVENSEVEQYIQFILGTTSSRDWKK